MSIPCLICVVILLLTELARQLRPQYLSTFCMWVSFEQLHMTTSHCLPDLVTAYKAQLGINMWKNTSNKNMDLAIGQTASTLLAVRHTHRHRYTQTHTHTHTRTHTHTHIYTDTQTDLFPLP